MMDELDDIAPAFELVEIGGKPLKIIGLSWPVLRTLATASPEVIALMAEKADRAQVIARMGPELLARIAAAAIGRPGDAKAQARLLNLAAGDLVEIIARTLKLTLPRGFDPFVQMAEQIGLGSALAEISSVFSANLQALRQSPAASAENPPAAVSPRASNSSSPGATAP